MDYNIITPQYVKIWQTPASVGERIIARIIDYFIIFVWLAFWFYSIAQLDYNGPDWPLLLAVILPVMFYTFLWETFNNGQTPGKKAMKIRVVRKDGQRPTIGDYFMRWILELVDIGVSFVGIIIIICTHNSQRLGDIAAGTMVIEVDRPLNMGITLNDFSYASRDYHPHYPQVENLSSGQVSVIQKALDKYYGDDSLSTLADKVSKKLGITRHEEPTKFLTTILHDYEYYATELI